MGIQEYLSQILSARYGRDVRQSIHDAIHQCYEDGKAGSTDLVARESIEDLEERLDTETGLLEIQSSTSSTLTNSKNGGYRLLEMVGNTVQNGTPSPDSPIPIMNTFDCVEMIQGAYAYASGVHAPNSMNYVCNKHKIPCKMGDKIRIETDNEMTQCGLIYYNGDTFVTSDYTRYDNQVRTDWEFTVPSGVTHFNFDIRNASNITPDTVGKIQLTINGKYVGCAKTHGKNLFDESLLLKATDWVFSGGYYTGLNYRLYSLYNNGFPIDFKENTQYTISVIAKSSITNDSTTLYIHYTDGTYESVAIGNSTTDKKTIFTTSSNKSVKMVAISFGNSATIYIKDFQIEENIVATEYEPYKETIAYFLTTYPLMQGSTLYKENGLFEVEHGSVEVVFDGSDDEAWGVETNTSGNVNFYILMSNAIGRRLVLCSHFPSVNFMGDIQNVYISTSKYLNIVSLLGFTTVTEWKTWLQSNPITVKYELATPITETLDTDSQLALNSLETFDGVTYIEVDSRVQPLSIKGEYGTSQVGAYTLKALNNTESNAVKIEDTVNTMLLIGAQ